MKRPMTIHMVASVRPNFMKIAPLYHELKKEVWAEPKIIHTGQHYDINMNDVFFNDLGLPEPDIHLGVRSGTHAYQTGNVMIEYEKILLESPPDLVIVVGDVNSTVAAAIAASKLGIKVMHLEAGLRSFDRTMPEELNRLTTDALSDYLLTPSIDGDENLSKEGVSKDRIIRVGNIMIDTLVMLKDKIDNQKTYLNYNLKDGSYAVLTLHRPFNVDHYSQLNSICQKLVKISERIKIIFPVHPRTRESLSKLHLVEKFTEISNLILTEPLGYLDFMNLVFHCKLVITDSGGIQEETSYLGIPCFTLRPNTERPVTITQGSNSLCNVENMESLIKKAVIADRPALEPIELWDGKTSERIVSFIHGMQM